MNTATVLALLSLVLGAPPRGASTTSTPVNLMPDCVAVTGPCPADGYFCLHSDGGVYRCEVPNTWSIISGGAITCSAATEKLRWTGTAWECVTDVSAGTPTFATIGAGISTGTTMAVGANSILLVSSDVPGSVDDGRIVADNLECDLDFNGGVCVTDAEVNDYLTVYGPELGSPQFRIWDTAVYPPSAGNYIEFESSNRSANYTLTWAVDADCSALVNGGKLTVDASNIVDCADDIGGPLIYSEDGDNAGTYTLIDTSTMQFDDEGDINFALTSGTPDKIAATIRDDKVDDDSIDFGTTGDKVSIADLTGTQISPTTYWDFSAAIEFEVPNSATYVPGTAGSIGLDTNLLSGQGLMLIHDSVQVSAVVAIKTTDTPGDGEVPKYDAGSGTILWAADSSGSAGDAIAVEAGDNGGASWDGIDTTARFEDQGDLNFVFADGGAGGPDSITAVIRADSVDDTMVDWGTGANQVSVADLAGDQVSGAVLWNLGGASSFEVPNADAMTTDATGEIGLDTLITDHQPLLQYYDGGENMTVIAIDTAELPATNGEIIKYNSTTDKFVLDTDGGGSGGGAIVRAVIEMPDTSSTYANYGISTDGTDVSAFRCITDSGTCLVNVTRTTHGVIYTAASFCTCQNTLTTCAVGTQATDAEELFSITTGGTCTAGVVSVFVW